MVKIFQRSTGHVPSAEKELLMQVSDEVRELWDLLLEPPSNLTNTKLKEVIDSEDAVLQVVHELWQQFPAKWKAERGRREQKEQLQKKSTAELEVLLATAIGERDAAVAALKASGERHDSSSLDFVRSETAVGVVAILEEILGERPDWAA